MMNIHEIDFVRKQHQSFSTVDASNKEEAKFIMETSYMPFESKGSVERDHRKGLMNVGCGPAVSCLVDNVDIA